MRRWTNDARYDRHAHRARGAHRHVRLLQCDGDRLYKLFRDAHAPLCQEEAHGAHRAPTERALQSRSDDAAHWQQYRQRHDLHRRNAPLCGIVRGGSGRSALHRDRHDRRAHLRRGHAQDGRKGDAGGICLLCRLSALGARQNLLPALMAVRQVGKAHLPYLPAGQRGAQVHRSGVQDARLGRQGGRRSQRYRARAHPQDAPL